MSKRKNLPRLSNDLIANIEMFIEQAEITSCSSRNTVEDLMLLSNKFLGTLLETSTREYVFWKIVDEYIYKKYQRPNHLRNIYCNLTPKYFLVYQLFKEGELLYIGKTTDIHRRLNSHNKNKEFDKVFLYRCLNEFEQNILEHTLIDKLKPRLNRALNLEYVRKDLDIPVFEDISTFHLDFFSNSSSDIRLNPTDHVFINCGFVSTSRLKNKPHWK